MRKFSFSILANLRQHNRIEDQINEKLLKSVRKVTQIVSLVSHTGNSNSLRNVCLSRQGIYDPKN